MEDKAIQQPQRHFDRRKVVEPENRINQYIRVPEVRLVGENVPIGIFSIAEALKMAEQQELDLVEISPNANPPVCKIIDYNKFLYDQKKKKKELKAKTSKVVIKEIRFGPNTDEHDYNFKLKHAEKFLQDGAKVKAYVFFKGRTILYKDKGEEMLKKFAQELEEVGKIEQDPKLEGKRMIIMINPVSKGKK